MGWFANGKNKSTNKKHLFQITIENITEQKQITDFQITIFMIFF